MIVPHGVARTGSHPEVPVTIVVDAPVARLMRTTPAWAGPSSLHWISHSGFWAFGQNAAMSRLGGATPALTTRTCRLWATVASLVGSAWASACVIELADEAASGPLKPKFWFDWSRSLLCTNRPKSPLVAPAMPTVNAITERTAATTASRFFIVPRSSSGAGLAPRKNLSPPDVQTVNDRGRE